MITPTPDFGEVDYCWLCAIFSGFFILILISKFWETARQFPNY